MRIIITKQLLPQLVSRLAGIKTMEEYQFDGYTQDELILEAPSDDLPLNVAVDIARVGATIEAYEYWVEVPNANLGDNVPSGLSYETYFDDQDPPVEQTRTWADLSELQENFAATATMRYYQPANNGEFLYNDIEIIEGAGFEVFGKARLNNKLNADYEDPGDPEYTVIETIEYIDDNWRFAGYFDFVHAWLRMQELYEAKGASDLDRWNASTDAEKQILVRWNQVGLNRAQTIVPPSWSEARVFKELSRAYREFEANVQAALEKRFEDYYQYLNLALSGSGRTKFETDWNWILKMQYLNRHLRFYELGETNDLIDWHNTTLATYTDADFVGTIPAAAIVSALLDVLQSKTYII